MDGVGGGHHHGARRREGEADDAGAGEKQVGAPGGVDAHHTLAAGNGRGHVKPALLIEGHALRAPEAAVEGLHLALVRDAEYRVEAGGGGPGDVEIAVGTEGQVVGRDGIFLGGEDEDLAAGTDLEDGTAAVADIEIVFAIEGNSGSHAHAFHVHAHVAVGRDLVDEAIVAAGDVQHALLIEDQRGGIHQLVDERLQGEVEIDSVDRHRHLLAARSAEGGEDVAERIDGGVGHGMQAVGPQHTDVAGPGLAGPGAAFDDEFAGGGALRNTGNDKRIGADDDGCAHFPDGYLGPFVLREALPPNLQLAAGNGRGRSDLGDERLGVCWFTESHI